MFKKASMYVQGDLSSDESDEIDIDFRKKFANTIGEFEHDGENYISTVVPHDFLDKLERGEKEIIEEEEESSCQYQCSVCPDVEIESLKELKEHLTSPEHQQAVDQAEGIYVSSDLASIEKEKKKKELNKKRAQENKLKRAREPKMNKWKKRKLERKKRKLEHNDNELENKTISSETKPAPVTPKVQLEKKDRNSPKKKDPNLKQRAKDRNLKKGAQKGKLKEKNHTKAD